MSPLLARQIGSSSQGGKSVYGEELEEEEEDEENEELLRRKCTSCAETPGVEEFYFCSSAGFVHSRCDEEKKKNLKGRCTDSCVDFLGDLSRQVVRQREKRETGTDTRKVKGVSIVNRGNSKQVVSRRKEKRREEEELERKAF